jgi:uncharacterized protein
LCALYQTAAVDYPDYDPQSPVTPLNGAELSALDHLLQDLPWDGVMTLDGLDGYLTALRFGPAELLQALPTSAWIPAVWGGDGPEGPAAAAPFASKRQRKATVVLVLRHLRHLADQITREPGAWEPIFSVAEQGPNEWVDAGDWCAGFMAAVDLLPSAWADLWADPHWAPLLAPILRLGGGLDGAAGAADAELSDPAVVDALSRAVPDAVLALAARPLGSPADL